MPYKVSGEDIPWTWAITSGPSTEPLTSTETKNFLRVSTGFTADDTFISGLITVARQAAETIIDRALIDQLITFYADDFPKSSDVILLPRPPLESVTSIKYYDTAGTQQTMSTGDYQVDIYSEPGRLYPDTDTVWPDVESGRANAVEIAFRAGYGSTQSSVPESIRTAMLMMIGHWYEHRESVAPGQMQEVPESAMMLLTHYKHAEAH